MSIFHAQVGYNNSLSTHQPLFMPVVLETVAYKAHRFLGILSQ